MTTCIKFVILSSGKVYSDGSVQEVCHKKNPYIIPPTPKFAKTSLIRRKGFKSTANKHAKLFDDSCSDDGDFFHNILYIEVNNCFQIIPCAGSLIAYECVSHL